MDRQRKLLFNTVTSLIYEILTIVCGFVIPHLIIANYGSNVNGLVNSITQFLGFISLCECGVGAVVQSAFYKPLAEKDNDSISKIYVSADKFFKKIAIILITYVIVLIFVYPLTVSDNFDFLFTVGLILVISITSLAQYFFGVTYSLLLSADQMAYIGTAIQSVALVLNTIACAVLIHFGASIHLVKLTTSCIFLFRPFFLRWYAQRHYKINTKIKYASEPIRQKWNGLAQHVSSVILNNTDVVVLTLFSSLENVSIYGVYFLVVNGVKQLVVASTNGMQAMLGNMLAKKEMDQLVQTYDMFEWMIHTITTFVFIMVGLLLIPFVEVYTNGIADINYIVPLFGILITAAHGFYCLRLPYNMMVLAAGHFKETQTSAFIEAAINIVLSVVLVHEYGIIGVAIGTLAAMIYRTTYLSWYLSKNLIYRDIKLYFKHIFIDMLTVALVILFRLPIIELFNLSNITYLSWGILAIKNAVICFALVVLINIVFYRKNVLIGVSIVKTRIRRINPSE